MTQDGNSNQQKKRESEIINKKINLTSLQLYKNRRKEWNYTGVTFL